jgi:hypothetical protein
MAVPVRFYSMTPEQYEKLRKSMGQGVDGSEEAEERRKAFEGSLFFVEDNKDAKATGEIHKV